MKQEDKKTILIITLLFVVIILSFSSCTKQETGKFEAVEEEVFESTPWQDEYTNAGTIPNWDSVEDNQLCGTNWVLIDVYANYAHVEKNDTIHFINNTKYTIGSNSYEYSYVLSSTMGNSTLQLNTFIPINGLTLSCSNFWAGMFESIQVNGTMQLLLNDVYSTTTYSSTFKRI